MPTFLNFNFFEADNLIIFVARFEREHGKQKIGKDLLQVINY